MSRKIPFAFFLKDWVFEDGNKSQLIIDGQKITASDFDIEEMRSSIFCPNCFTNLTRSPLQNNISVQGITAHFKHLPTYKHIPCIYRASKGEGFNYNNEAEARQAIEDNSLVIVHHFKTEEPNLATEINEEVQENYENEIDATSNVTVNRHCNLSYNLPAKITTVRGGICRNFANNLSRGYYFPFSNQILPLSDLLNNVESLNEIQAEKRLFIGRIKSSKHLGKNPTDNNIRMTYLEYRDNNDYKDFCIKSPNWLQRKHGISDTSIGRFVIFYGAITENGIGLCVENIAYGEIGLLSERYNNIAEELVNQ